MLLGPAEAERQREAGYSANIGINFGNPSPDAARAISLDALFAEAAAAEQERSAKWANDGDRIFRAWHAFLSAHHEFESAKTAALRYSGIRFSGRTVCLSATDPIPSDIVGQDRLVRHGGRSIALQVLAVDADELTLSVLVGDASQLPQRGVLEINNLRAEKALDRQRQALNAVMHRRSVNQALRDLISDPSSARPPGSLITPADPGDRFDTDKREVLAKALNFQDVLVVEGPPGTGKTRLIEEIIVQHLVNHPADRILVSSQTHIALDNIINRVTERSLDVDIVRIGHPDDPRIGKVATGLLLERKATEWSKRVISRSKEWLTAWATENGVDPADVEGGVLALRLARLVGERNSIDQQLLDIQNRQQQIASTLASRLDELALSAEGETLQQVETIDADLERLHRQRDANAFDQNEIRSRLASLGGLRSDLALINSAQDLIEFAHMFLSQGAAHERCHELIKIQEEWLERVGRSSDFQTAILTSANVVAATCVGLAAVRGIESVAFDLCIIDEASKATATELLVPMSRSRRTILVGDPKQLPPFFERALLQSTHVSDFDESELRQSVFDLFLSKLPPHCRDRLTHQHRMVKAIGDLVSAVFYDKSLISDREKADVAFPSFQKPVVWLDTSQLGGRRERREGTSYANEIEARVIRNVLRTLAFTSSRRKGAKYDVAVIAGYQAQVRAISAATMDELHTWTGLDVRVNTVDAFQGSEADVCIYSVVRSNNDFKVGFLAEPPRLNVALSRGRSLLIIVGDHEFCSSLGPELPMAGVIRYIAEHPDDCEVRHADDT